MKDRVLFLSCARNRLLLIAATAVLFMWAAAAFTQSPSSVQPPPLDRQPVADALSSAPKATITNGLIRATVLLPDPKRGFYRASRFDRSGMIASLKLGGTEYYGPWFRFTAANVRDYVFDQGDIVAGPNTAALGPAEAFDPVTAAGWDATPVGGSFLKVGVGMLRKPDGPPAYSAFRPYDLVVPGTWSQRLHRNGVEFTHRLTDTASGFSYVYRKSIKLVPGRPQMRIDHELMNVGRNAIVTSVFNHNFLTLGGRADRSGLTVQTAFQIATTRMPPADSAILSGDTIRYRRALADGEVVSLPMTGFGSDAADSRISVRTSAGSGVDLESDRPLSRLLLWSIRDTIAVEPFVAVHVQPGRTFRWSWLYTYR